MMNLKSDQLEILLSLYSESTEPIDAVNILPLARFEPTTSTTPPSTTPDIDATNCATETAPKKYDQVALIFVCLFVLLLYVPSQQLWSLRDGQFT